VIWVGGRAALLLCCGILLSGSLSPLAAATGFHFERDTLAFANSTVFEYHQGIARLRRGEKEKSPRYTRRCFTMCRTVVQFQKFARFDPHAPALNDEELAKRVRSITRHPAWRTPFPSDQRIVIPGYANLRQLSEKRGWVLQKNIGLGWPTYARIGNWRMFYNHSKRYQQTTHKRLNETLGRGEMFVAYLSDFPTLHINHAVLVYARKPSSADGIDRYDCYDPNHTDGPRELVWTPSKSAFDYQKDEEFVGGYARVYQVYGRPLQ
jgi:hypothetical protein